ncbi:MAG: hypothetical protein M4D80_05290 [Myxococcota bacterium]|nr:hypothetical protein [Myxococcota bacterium]
MNKVSVIVAALALSCAFAACKKKEDKAADPPKADTTTTAPPPGSVQPTPPPAPVGDLPEECARHKASADRFGSCEKLPADVRAGVKSSWAMMTRSIAGYDKMSADDQATAKKNCAMAADALKAFEKDCP